MKCVYLHDNNFDIYHIRPSLFVQDVSVIPIKPKLGFRLNSNKKILNVSKEKFEQFGFIIPEQLELLLFLD